MRNAEFSDFASVAARFNVKPPLLSTEQQAIMSAKPTPAEKAGGKDESITTAIPEKVLSEDAQNARAALTGAVWFLTRDDIVTEADRMQLYLKAKKDQGQVFEKGEDEYGFLVRLLEMGELMSEDGLSQDLIKVFNPNQNPFNKEEEEKFLNAVTAYTTKLNLTPEWRDDWQGWVEEFHRKRITETVVALREASVQHQPTRELEIRLGRLFGLPPEADTEKAYETYHGSEAVLTERENIINAFITASTDVPLGHFLLQIPEIHRRGFQNLILAGRELRYHEQELKSSDVEQYRQRYNDALARVDIAIRVELGINALPNAEITGSYARIRLFTESIDRLGNQTSGQFASETEEIIINEIKDLLATRNATVLREYPMYTESLQREFDYLRQKLQAAGLVFRAKTDGEGYEIVRMSQAPAPDAAAGIAATTPARPVTDAPTSVVEAQLRTSELHVPEDIDQFKEAFPVVYIQGAESRSFPPEIVQITSNWSETVERFTLAEHSISALEMTQKEDDSIGIAVTSDGIINLVVADGVSNTASGLLSSRMAVRGALKQLENGSLSKETLIAAHDAIQGSPLDAIATNRVQKIRTSAEQMEDDPGKWVSQKELRLDFADKIQRFIDRGNISSTTFIAAQYDRDNSRIGVAMRGDSSFVICRADGTIQFLSDDTLAGSYTYALSYSTDPTDRNFQPYQTDLYREFDLADGDVVFLASDGVSNGFYERINEFLVEQRRTSPNTRLDQEVISYMFTHPDESLGDDDVSLIALHHRTSAKPLNTI